MRLVIALALGLAEAGAAAQPVSTAPLAAREVLLEIDADGSVRTPADQIFLTAQIQTSGVTSAEARAALAALEARVVAAARAAGVAPDDVAEARQDNAIGFVGNQAAATAMIQGDEARQTARKSLEVRVRDPSSIERLRAALEAAGATQVSDPIYTLADDSAARQAARAQGLTRARADADAFARSLGMRVGRIVRVSERPTVETASLMMMQAMMRRMFGRGGGPSPEVETQVHIAVDFALVPQ